METWASLHLFRRKTERAPGAFVIDLKWFVSTYTVKHEATNGRGKVTMVRKNITGRWHVALTPGRGLAGSR